MKNLKSFICYIVLIIRIKKAQLLTIFDGALAIIIIYFNFYVEI